MHAFLILILTLPLFLAMAALLLKFLKSRGSAKWTFAMASMIMLDLLLSGSEFATGPEGLESRLALDCSMFLFPAMLFHNSFMKAGIVLLFCIPVSPWTVRCSSSLRCCSTILS